MTPVIIIAISLIIILTVSILFTILMYACYLRNSSTSSTPSIADPTFEDIFEIPCGPAEYYCGYCKSTHCLPETEFIDRDEAGSFCKLTVRDVTRAVHELMHSLGIFHEQSRADRDMFVKVHEDNVLPDFLTNFDKQSLENTTYSYEYDYGSIMHYGSHYFSRSPDKPTLTSTMPGVKFGQRKGMSKTDCLKVNELYGCLGKPSQSRRWYNICNTLGL